MAGMFRFFQCMPVAKGRRGFERPVILLPGVVKDTHKQSKKLNPQPDINATRSLWNKVVEQVERQGRSLGVYASMPPRE